jgi:hypothetical protein
VDRLVKPVTHRLVAGADLTSQVPKLVGCSFVEGEHVPWPGREPAQVARGLTVR